MRLRTPAGGRVDRSRPLSFRFDGQTFRGLLGDSLASALLANGVHVLGRSFKYHRPRGLLAAGAEEPNALVGIRRDAARFTPNVRATTVELYEGLEAESQNRWPSLAFDVGAVNDFFSPFLPAGFYYKTFMWPRRAWHALYEPLIRAAAGLGRAPTAPDPDRYTQRYAHCDVLVVGAGPTGLAAALAAAEGGARVMLCDEQSEFGGSLLAETSAQIESLPAQDWLADAVDSLVRQSRVTLLPRTTAFGYFPHNFLGLHERVTDHLGTLPGELPRERLWQVRAREVVLATGAIERPLVFPGNDRPGVMLAAAARTYLNRYGVLAGTRAVVVTANDAAYQTALELKGAGVEIVTIADVRPTVDGPWPVAAREAGLAVLTGATVLGTDGRRRVSRIRLGRIAGDMVRPAGRLACDLVLMSGGFTPSVHLHSQSRGTLAWRAELKGFVPDRAAERSRAAGACRGIFGLRQALEDGANAGAAAARATGRPARARSFAAAARESGVDAYAGALPQPGGKHGGKAFVDFQNDVTAKDLAQAQREGMASIEHIKRFTTTGMATDQGKTSNVNALALVAAGLGKSIPEVGLTTFRMPYTPVSFGAFAGTSRRDLFDPVRKTAIHDWAAARGAVFEDVGLWKRARYFPQAGEDMHAAVGRECRAVRGACGLFDASTLGKIEVVGRDAAVFLERLYVNSWQGLAVSRARYGILTREDGFIYDDGVVGRTAPDRFHVTTTTGGAARVLAMMEDYVQTEWSELRVWLTSTTEQWSVIAVQGPNARKVIERLVEGIDLGSEALPHMGIARGRILGVPLLLFRVSFTGELGFELNVPADYGRAVWEAVWAMGQAHGIVAYGTETMHVLRAEKGYLIVGQDTDGTVTPDDAGLAWAIGKAKVDFVGKRSLARASMHSPNRKQLVGLLTEDPAVVLEEGAQLVASPGQRPPMRLVGHVSSAYQSAVLGRSIALGLLEGGRARHGERVYVPMPDGDLPVTVQAPVFYDPTGARLHG
jgi:sarcosine oxidase subunit alpha